MLVQISHLGNCLAGRHFRAPRTAEDTVGHALGVLSSVRMYIHQSPHSLACEEDAPLRTRAQDRTMLSPSVLLPHAGGWIGQRHSVGTIFVSSPPERESTHVDLEKVPVLQYDCPTEEPSTTPTKQVLLLLRYLCRVPSQRRPWITAPCVAL